MKRLISSYPTLNTTEIVSLKRNASQKFWRSLQKPWKMAGKPQGGLS